MHLHKKLVSILLILFLITPGSGLIAYRINSTSISGTSTPDWADGFFNGSVEINGKEYGGVNGFILLARNDNSGNISGVWYKGENEIFFKGIFFDGMVVCFTPGNGIFPFIGFLESSGSNFHSTVWRIGTPVLDIKGSYDASMLPMPGGNYSMGVQVVHLVDEEREEKITENPDDKREMIVKIWYPSTINEGERTEYMDPKEFSWLRNQGPIPLFWIPKDAYTYVKTHSFIDAPVAKGKFPVIIFSHGYRGYPSMYTSMIENLVSHGFIVAAITHPYVAGITVFPDGRAVELPDLSNASNEYIQWYFKTAFDEVMGDIDYVCNYLIELNSTDERWAGKMDCSKMGIYGHSFGGGAAAMECYDNEHIKAGLAMDGYFRGDVLEEGIEKPFFMFFVEGRFESDESLQNFWDALEGDAYRASIAGSAHQDYTDLPILLSHLMPNIPRSVISGFGSIDGKRLVKIVNAFILAFFDVYLNGKPVDELISLEDDFNEVIFDHK